MKSGGSLLGYPHKAMSKGTMLEGFTVTSGMDVMMWNLHWHPIMSNLAPLASRKDKRLMMIECGVLEAPVRGRMRDPNGWASCLYEQTGVACATGVTGLEGVVAIMPGERMQMRRKGPARQKDDPNQPEEMTPCVVHAYGGGDKEGRLERQPDMEQPTPVQAILGEPGIGSLICAEGCSVGGEKINTGWGSMRYMSSKTKKCCTHRRAIVGGLAVARKNRVETKTRCLLAETPHKEGG